MLDSGALSLNEPECLTAVCTFLYGHYRLYWKTTDEQVSQGEAAAERTTTQPESEPNPNWASSRKDHLPIRPIMSAAHKKRIRQ